MTVIKLLLVSSAFVAGTAPSFAQEVPDDVDVVIDYPAPVDDTGVDVDIPDDDVIIGDDGYIGDGGYVDDGYVVDEPDVVIDDGALVDGDPGVFDGGGDVAILDDPAFEPGTEFVDPPVDITDNELIYYTMGGPAGDFEAEVADQAAELAAEQAADRVAERVEMAAANAATAPETP